jgi:nucleoside-diphosphate-sugar epimerase
MRALLVGASGYLGARVHRAAVAAGIEVVTAGRSAGGPGHVTLDLSGGPDAVGAMIAGVAPDVVLNCAGATSGDLAALSAGNVDGPAALVTALVRMRPGPSGAAVRLVHLGSAAEYGRGPEGPVREDEPARPLSPYGLTKLAGTRLVQLGRAAGLPAVVLRVFNPVGPGAPGHTLPGRAASELARAVRENDVVRLGGLDAVRDFVDVDDVAAAVLAAATGPMPADGIVNVGSGTAVPARELVSTLVDVSGARVRIEEGDGGSARSADVPWQQADITAATAAWDWQPRTPLAVSLEGLWRQAA